MAREQKRILGIELGSRATVTGQRLYQTLDRSEVQQVMTDRYKPYEAIVPRSLHHPSKAQTYTVEGYNSLFRHFLARLRRKSKCYSKSIEMLRYSLLLFQEKWNSRLALLNDNAPMSLSS